VVVLSEAAGFEKMPSEIGANVYLRKGEFRPTELCERIAELVQARDSLPRRDADQAASAAMARLD
jgi:hypothetical protein